MLNDDAGAAAEIWEKIWCSEPDARPLAALILCELIGNKPLHAPHAGVDEQTTSVAFIQWYQRLIGVQATTVIAKINEQMEPLKLALPAAAAMLEAALTEAATPENSGPGR